MKKIALFVTLLCLGMHLHAQVRGVHTLAHTDFPAAFSLKKPLTSGDSLTGTLAVHYRQGASPAFMQVQGSHAWFSCMRIVQDTFPADTVLEIPWKLRTRGVAGSLKSSASIMLSGKEAALWTLPVTAEVKPDPAWNIQVKKFRQSWVQAGDTLKASFEVRNLGDKDLMLTMALPPPGVKVTFSHTRAAPGATVRIVLTNLTQHHYSQLENITEVGFSREDGTRFRLHFRCEYPKGMTPEPGMYLSLSSRAEVSALEHTLLSMQVPEVDFGTVTEGDAAYIEFPIMNEGPSQVLIDQMKPSCGCVTCSFPTEPLLPGSTFYLRCKIDTAHKPGPMLKSAFVMFRGGVMNLKMQGYVKPATP